MMDCIFCKIIRGEIPGYVLYEDDNLLAILDISQSTKGHTLILSKAHVPNLYGLDSEQAAAIFAKVPLIANAIKQAFHPIGLNMLVNVGQPLQSVFHFHIHLIPRYADDTIVMTFENNYGKIKQETFQEIAAKIKRYL
jgi:histidine triad (HIT) family protein